MKQYLAAFIVLLANMILFVHAVIPHHHHENILCFETYVAGQSTSDCCTESCHSEADHQHDSDKSSDNCMLSHIVALFNGDIKQNIRTTISSHDLTNDTPFLAIQNRENSKISNQRFFVEIVFNDHIPIYHSLAIKSFGLRAPPVSC